MADIGKIVFGPVVDHPRHLTAEESRTMHDALRASTKVVGRCYSDAEIAELQARVERAEAELDQMAATVSAHDAEVIASLNAELAEVRVALKTAEEDVGIARKAYCTLEAERDRLAEEVADRNGEIYRLHSELAHMKIHADRLREALKPFAEEADRQDRVNPYADDHCDTYLPFTIGQCRAARAALEAASDA